MLEKSIIAELIPRVPVFLRHILPNSAADFGNSAEYCWPYWCPLFLDAPWQRLSTGTDTNSTAALFLERLTNWGRRWNWLLIDILDRCRSSSGTPSASHCLLTRPPLRLCRCRLTSEWVTSWTDPHCPSTNQPIQTGVQSGRIKCPITRQRYSDSRTWASHMLSPSQWQKSGRCRPTLTSAFDFVRQSSLTRNIDKCFQDTSQHGDAQPRADYWFSLATNNRQRRKEV